MTTTTFIIAAEPTGSVNHLNTCQSPTQAYCQERAEFWVQYTEGNADVSLMVCAFHADELRQEVDAEIFDTVR